MLNGKIIKIYKAHYTIEDTPKQPGIFDTDKETYLRFAAKDGWFYIDELQQEGKKKMDIVSFLRGFRG